ncbi:MAG: hypothetical protein JNJ61_20815 [Anaerolineae bacterium]|nr:hypothetical protein [Anaerolineae bacterium]
MSQASSGNLSPGTRSKYRRPRRPVSWMGLLLGLLIGIGGGLGYAWLVDPRVEFDTQPWQLEPNDRANYIVAITLGYAYDGDLGRAVERLLALNPPGQVRGDPIQEVADVACRLATSGYVDNSSGLRAIQQMMVFYQLQGRSGCADNLIPLNQDSAVVVTVEAATPTPQPPASKTPTPEAADRATPTPLSVVVPTAVPRSSYVVAAIRTYCSTTLSGLIEVRVQDFNGDGIPGQAVRVRWQDGDNRFVTGLKPERGPDYADFEMQADLSYTVELPGQSDPTQPLVAAPCTTEAGQQAITSYQVFFRPSG